MNAWVRRSLKAGALTAGAVMATGTAAYADSTLISAGNTGILNGTQVFAPIQAPINLCGVAGSVLGTATAGCEGGSTAIQGLQDVKMLSAGNTGILNGTQVYVPIQAPINICGIAVGVLGKAAAGCEGGSEAIIGKPGGGGHHGKAQPGHKKESTRQAEILGGLPVVGGLTQGLPLVGGLSQGGGLPIVGGLMQGGLGQGGGLPIVGDLLGGGLGGGLLGGGLGGGPLGDPLGGSPLGGGFLDRGDVDLDALDSVGTVPQTESDGGHSNGGNPGQGGGCGSTCPAPPVTPPAPPGQQPPHKPCPTEHGFKGKDIKLVSTGNTGIGNGTQIYAPIQVPIDISGVAVGVLGNALAWSEGGSSARM
jgi:hypothetical protein